MSAGGLADFTQYLPQGLQGFLSNPGNLEAPNLEDLDFEGDYGNPLNFGSPNSSPNNVPNPVPSSPNIASNPESPTPGLPVPGLGTVPARNLEGIESVVPDEENDDHLFQDALSEQPIVQQDKPDSSVYVGDSPPSTPRDVQNNFGEPIAWVPPVRDAKPVPRPSRGANGGDFVGWQNRPKVFGAGTDTPKASSVFDRLRAVRKGTTSPEDRKAVNFNASAGIKKELAAAAFGRKASTSTATSPNVQPLNAEASERRQIRQDLCASLRPFVKTRGYVSQEARDVLERIYKSETKGLKDHPNQIPVRRFEAREEIDGGQPAYFVTMTSQDVVEIYRIANKIRSAYPDYNRWFVSYPTYLLEGVFKIYFSNLSPYAFERLGPILAENGFALSKIDDVQARDEGKVNAVAEASLPVGNEPDKPDKDTRFLTVDLVRLMVRMWDPNTSLDGYNDVYGGLDKPPRPGSEKEARDYEKLAGAMAAQWKTNYPVDFVRWNMRIRDVLNTANDRDPQTNELLYSIHVYPVQAQNQCLKRPCGFKMAGSIATVLATDVYLRLVQDESDAVVALFDELKVDDGYNPTRIWNYLFDDDEVRRNAILYDLEVDLNRYVNEMLYELNTSNPLRGDATTAALSVSAAVKFKLVYEPDESDEEVTVKPKFDYRFSDDDHLTIVVNVFRFSSGFYKSYGFEADSFGAAFYGIRSYHNETIAGSYIDTFKPYGYAGDSGKTSTVFRYIVLSQKRVASNPGALTPRQVYQTSKDFVDLVYGLKPSTPAIIKVLYNLVLETCHHYVHAIRLLADCGEFRRYSILEDRYDMGQRLRHPKERLDEELNSCVLLRLPPKYVRSVAKSREYGAVPDVYMDNAAAATDEGSDTVNGRTRKTTFARHQNTLFALPAFDYRAFSTELPRKSYTFCCHYDDRVDPVPYISSQAKDGLEPARDVTLPENPSKAPAVPAVAVSNFDYLPEVDRVVTPFPVPDLNRRQPRQEPGFFAETEPDLPGFQEFSLQQAIVDDNGMVIANANQPMFNQYLSPANASVANSIFDDEDMGVSYSDLFG